MAKRKAGNLIKGLAWLLMAAAVLPTFSSTESPTGKVTALTLGLPWSPWLVYRESWNSSAAGEFAAAAGFGYQTALQPQCWSAACLGAGVALAALSHWLRSAQRYAAAPMPATFRKPTVFRA